MAARYIAGEDLADACQVVRGLNLRGKRATLAVLGEEVATEAEAAHVVNSYLEAIQAIAREGLVAGLSVKPTALGLKLGAPLCRVHLEAIVSAAAGCGRFVRIDMEDSSTTSATLAVYREIRAAGFDNVGIVLQSRLRRTLEDARQLAALRPSVRLCKGIYRESEDVAFREDAEVTERFLRIADELLAAGCYVAFATHAEGLLKDCMRLAAERGRDPDSYECQLLFGVCPDLGDRLTAHGQRVRLYVPYGHRSHEYALRRLQDNPHMAAQVARAALRHPGRRRRRNDPHNTTSNTPWDRR